MGVVRGERIGDSRKLAVCTPLEQDAYARLVATLPDSFGRYRLSWTQVVGRLYPRLEDPRAIGRQVARWQRLHETFERQELLQIWEVDRIAYAELTGWRRSESAGTYHRTPEPPWSGHAHTSWCLATAIARLREVGDFQKAEALSIALKELRDGRSNVRSSVGSTGLVTVPAPSVPSIPITDNPPLPPLPPQGGNGDGTALRQRIEEARLFAIEVGFHPSRRDIRTMREWVYAGRSAKEIHDELDRLKAEGEPITPVARKL